MWVGFFAAAGIPADTAATYALTFAENRIQGDMLLDLNKEYLRDMGIARMGDVIAILRHAKQVHESVARERVLSTSAAGNKVPVAAVTGRATTAQPSSPAASRMLERYTRNPPAPAPAPAPASAPSPAQLKRTAAEVGQEGGRSGPVKKARLIRFGTPPQTALKEALPTKQTVFARLGNSEPAPAAQAATLHARAAPAAPTAPAKPDAKPVFARLGSKPDQVIPIARDALKYEGILKGDSVQTVKKVVTVTTTKNNVRRIACTMRADETPVSVKEKLALPKAKTVKFSSTIQYKEIEANQKAVIPKPRFTPVFNKPERRLSMPDSVKGRLGLKEPSNLTITRNVFNRLGV